MKKAEVKIGALYIAKVSGCLTHVRIVCESASGGWHAINVRTGRDIYIRGAQRLRKEVAA